MTRLDDPTRLRRLKRAALLHAGDDEAFDSLTERVRDALDVPVSTVTFVAPERQVFRGASGLDEPWASTRETPIGYSFCQHCILSAQPFVIDDARRHPLVRESPAIDELGVIAYAGVPIVSSDGVVLGTLCAIDHEPRAWSDNDVATLRRLSAEALAEIERRTLEAEVAAHEARPRNAASGERGEHVGAGLNISALAKRTGVAADTLRKWEHRYQVIRPTRTTGGQRRYTEQDVARIEWLRDRLREGYRIGEAAALLGQGGTDTPQTAEDFRARILAAARADDAPAVGRLLDQCFALHAVERTLTQVVSPLLGEIGQAWQRGELSVAQEHLATETIRGRLVHLLADARGAVRGVAVLACPSNERHDLGLLMLAILLRADGWQVAYLGADTPLQDALQLAERVDARLLCFSVAQKAHAEALQKELADSRVPKGLSIVVGGASATDTLAQKMDAARVNHDLPQSVQSLRAYAAA